VWLGLPAPTVLAVGAAVAGVAVALGARFAAVVGARRRAARARSRLRAAIGQVTDERLAGPVGKEMRALQRCRTALVWRRCDREQAPCTRLRIPVQLRWSDMDAYGHINNVEMLRVLEEARIAAFWTHPDPPADGGWPTAVLAAGPGATTEMLVARQEIEYVRRLGTGARRSWSSCGSVISAGRASTCATRCTTGDLPGDGAAVPYARACTTLALVDPATGAPRRLTAPERAAWSPT